MPSGRKTKCMAANGSEMETDGMIQVDFTTQEGHLGSIDFDNIKGISMPIISVRKMAKKDHSVCFTKTVGFMRHEPTGRISKFVGRDGVYFIKLIMPHARPTKHKPNNDFGRRG